MRQNVTAVLKMPTNYAEMSEEEMTYLEGGSTYYNAATCVNKYKEAYDKILQYTERIQNVDATSCPGAYLAYARYINMYNYAYKQYKAGASKIGVDFYYCNFVRQKIVVR